LRQMIANGRLDPDAETVVLNTGDGLKTLDAVVAVAVPTATIRPGYDAFEAAARLAGLL
jgi:threonine synthase